MYYYWNFQVGVPGVQAIDMQYKYAHQTIKPLEIVPNSVDNKFRFTLVDRFFPSNEHIWAIS